VSSGLLSVRGRFGYAVGRVLPYITGGLAYGEIDPSVTATGAGSVYSRGLAVGGGFEVAATHNWLARLEYLYFDFGHYTCGACGITTPDHVTLNMQTVRAALSYKLDL
jgi:outer membrane immunogenic protein